MQEERMCTLEGCENYRGFDVGYCHKFKVILRGQEKKDFFAQNCDENWDLEAIEVMWQGEERLKTWEPES
jgi:hypothetical protein